ncbi:MAG: hypothetical protein H0U27_14225, partial [Nitrosopumilus sp.]|nr:hypothetical protein [Nitrosopumilus sp.]
MPLVGESIGITDPVIGYLNVVSLETQVGFGEGVITSNPTAIIRIDANVPTPDTKIILAIGHFDANTDGSIILDLANTVVYIPVGPGNISITKTVSNISSALSFIYDKPFDDLNLLGVFVSSTNPIFINSADFPFTVSIVAAPQT